MKRYKRILKIGSLAIVALIAITIYGFRVQEWTGRLTSDFIVYGQTGTSTGGTTATTTYLPQIADGGGYSTTFTILNVNASPVVGTLRLFNQDGSPKVLRMNNSSSSQFTVSVPANGTVRLTTPNSGNLVSIGWATLESTTRLQAVATYDYRVGNTLFATAGILGTTGAQRVVVPIDLDGSVANTGLAIANVQSNSIVVRLRLYNEAGAEVANVLDSRLNPLGAQRQTADFIGGFFSNISGSFKGSVAVEVVGSGVVGVAGLSFKEGVFSAVPTIDVGPTTTTTPPTVSAPTLIGLSPSSGSAGSTVAITLNGTNFVSGGTTVQVSGSGITVGSAQVTGTTSLTGSLTIASSANAGDRTITVTTAGGTSNGVTFRVTTAGGVEVVRAYTKNTSDIETTTFSPGQTIRFVMDRNSSLTTEVTLATRYLVTGPNSNVVYDGNVSASTAPPGRHARYVEWQVPSTAQSGTYTYTASVTYNGVTSSKSATFTIGSGGTTTTSANNRSQTERLMGTWTFTHTTASTTTSIYRLNDLQESTSTPGQWYIFGTNQSNGIVIAGYSPDLERFILLDQATTIDKFFIFDFTGAITVSGCLYQLPHGNTSNLGSCYNMTGTRTSTSTLTSNLSISKHNAAMQSQELVDATNQLRVEPSEEILRPILEAMRDNQRRHVSDTATGR